MRRNVERKCKAGRKSCVLRFLQVFFFPDNPTWRKKKEKKGGAGNVCFLILFTALIYLTHLPNMRVHSKKEASPPAPPLYVSHQATDWAISDGHALKRLVRHLKRQPVGLLTLLQMCSSFKRTYFFPSIVQEPGFTSGHSLGAQCSEHLDHALPTELRASC